MPSWDTKLVGCTPRTWTLGSKELENSPLVHFPCTNKNNCWPLMLLMMKQSFQSIGEEGSVWQHDRTKSLGAGPQPHTTSLWTQLRACLLDLRPSCSNLYSGTGLWTRTCPLPTILCAPLTVLPIWLHSYHNSRFS